MAATTAGNAALAAVQGSNPRLRPRGPSMLALILLQQRAHQRLLTESIKKPNRDLKCCEI